MTLDEEVIVTYLLVLHLVQNSLFILSINLRIDLI